MKTDLKFLPTHGKIACNRCFGSVDVRFDISQRSCEKWRITANPLAWGNINPEVVVLGFSKGPTQLGAIANSAHDEIAYKGHRTKIAKIFKAIGLLDSSESVDATTISKLISTTDGRFHFGSLIRCTVEQFNENTQEWIGSGGGMLDKFMKSDFGEKVASNCATQHLSELPTRTKLIVMFGLGQKLNYVNSAFQLFQKIRPREWKRLNDVSYTDGQIVIVHVEHFASQGNLLPQWLGEKEGERVNYMLSARESVAYAIASNPPLSKGLAPIDSNLLTNECKSLLPAKPLTQKCNMKDSTLFNDDFYRSLLIEKRYLIVADNAKLLGARAPSGEAIYIVKSQSRSNQTVAFVHPRFDREKLCAMPSVEEVSGNHQFHTNMVLFPKKFNKGKTETTFGWQIRISTKDQLDNFLQYFSTNINFE